MTTAPDLDEVRPLPESIPPIVRHRVKEILADPALDGKRIAFIAAVNGYKIPGESLPVLGYNARVAVMVNFGRGWSFSTFTEKPYDGPLEFGAELRVAR